MYLRVHGWLDSRTHSHTEGQMRIVSVRVWENADGLVHNSAAAEGQYWNHRRTNGPTLPAYWVITWPMDWPVVHIFFFPTSFVIGCLGYVLRATLSSFSRLFHSFLHSFLKLSATFKRRSEKPPSIWNIIHICRDVWFLCWFIKFMLIYVFYARLWNWCHFMSIYTFYVKLWVLLISF